MRERFAGLGTTRRNQRVFEECDDMTNAGAFTFGTHLGRKTKEILRYVE
jgi:hypothetical protein